ncbi:MAG: hypothetical protein ACUVWZ_01600 [Anaerolineae bacterium]
MSEQYAGKCPACGRFVGPYAACPYCGAEVGQHISIRFFKYGSLVLAIAGVVVLLVIAPRSQAPVVQIGTLTGTMNFAYVRVHGSVIRQPTYDPDHGSLYFGVADETGEMMVVAYRSEARDLLAKEIMPVVGDEVTLDGTVRVKEDYQYLVLHGVEGVAVRAPEPVSVAIGMVSSMPLYHKVTVRGVIRDLYTPDDGLCILSLSDASGDIKVALYTASAAWGSEWPELEKGLSVQVTGAVDRYRGAPQISVGRGSDLLLLDQDVSLASERSIASLSAQDVGSRVIVQGNVSRPTRFSSGIRCVLDDGSGTITLVLWQDLVNSLGLQEMLPEGAVWRVQAKVAEYKGRLELVPELPSDVRVLAAAALPSAELEREFEVRRTKVERPSVLQSMTVQISPTDIVETFPVPTATAIPSREPTTPSRSIGTPTPSRTPSPTPSPSPTFEIRTIGAITAHEVGGTFTIDRARIVEVFYFSKGVKYKLKDRTGEILLLVWQDVLEKIGDRYDLYPNCLLQVTGEIQEYEGDLEIIPARGSDVRVMARSDRLPIEERAANNITPSDEGRIFTVIGKVMRTETRSWLKIWINDGTGEILIFIPERVVGYLPVGIGGNVRLRVTGEVDIYQGVLELIPLAGRDVEVQ